MTDTSHIRVASVQMAVEHTADIKTFFARLEHFVSAAAEREADFVCFPEHFTLQILSGWKEQLDADASIDALTGMTQALEERLCGLATDYRINIIGGSHATHIDGGGIRNIAVLAHRDGRLSRQAKLQPTPDEREVWNITGGDELDIIDTDCGPVGILICYDSEFPELGRRLADRGAGLIFVPYCTETIHGHLRVRYCCHARTVENQCYVVTSGLVGSVGNVTNFDTAHAQSAILTPSDLPFAAMGIAAEAAENAEQIIFADLDMGLLEEARTHGAVRPLADRRHDLYGTRWKGEN